MGFAISDFWAITPCDFGVVLEGYRQRKIAEQDIIITNAWLSAAWQRQKKLGSLDKILKHTKPKQPMSDKAMQKMCMALNKMYGGEVRSIGNT